MAKIKWDGYIEYESIPTNDPEAMTFSSHSPVFAFSVKGGIYRQLKMSAMDETSLPLEFQDARKFSNLMLYLNPKNNLSVLNELMAISTNQLTFGIFFRVLGSIGSKLTHIFTLASGDVKITDLSIRSSGKMKNIPVVKLNIIDPYINFEQGDVRTGEFQEVEL